MRSPVGVILIVCAVFLSGCQLFSSGGERDPGDSDTLADAAAPNEDEVTLTIYLRTGSSGDARLAAVSRTVRAEGNLAQRAVELLLEGGTEEESLESPWPAGTVVRDVRVADGIAYVDLSRQALTEAPAQERAAHLEMLAMAALANTLTEFPTIEQVSVEIDGQLVAEDEMLRAFWGGWGLPPLLVRDMSLVAEPGSGHIPALADFSLARQSVGSDETAPVLVRKIRVRDRITYVRVVIEIADAERPEEAPPDYPRAHARTSPGEVKLELTGVAEVDQEAIPTDLDVGVAPFLAELRVEEGLRPDSLQILVSKAGEFELRSIHLHTAVSPSRIILDILK